jgi:cysteine synthase A
MDVLGAIGNTPLVELRRLVPSGSARILLKLEMANPTGSMKDRMARAVIEAAERRRQLAPGGTVVEYTGGTTGISLAFLCAAKGYKIQIVFSDAFSQEKALIMKALGARLAIVPSEGRGITENLVRQMIEKARALSREPGHWWSDQLRNEDAMGGYHALGEEIWRQSKGRVDAFVHSVGTAHSLHGATEALSAHGRSIHVVALEPEESAVLSGRAPGAHNIEGIGIGYKVHEIMTVSTPEAKAMARRLARVEGIFAGTSSGANVVAALRVAGRLGPKATVVTLAVDTGQHYLSTDLFRE